MLLHKLLVDDEPSPENQQLYRELLVEANTQLALFTMPEDLFAKYKEIIKMTQYEDMKGSMQEDPRRAYKRLKI